MCQVNVIRNRDKSEKTQSQQLTVYSQQFRRQAEERPTLGRNKNAEGRPPTRSEFKVDSSQLTVLDEKKNEDR
jgi:hypothetical protein